MDLFGAKSRAIPITQREVLDAYERVKRNKGSGGVDGVSFDVFEKDLLNNLRKIWNDLTFGRYLAKPVREVIVPKRNGGERKLGIPTIRDRIAQSVIRYRLEPRLEAIFSDNSYAYRPNRGQKESLEKVKLNTWKHAWVIDMDIKSFFDEVDHELLLKALDKHVSEDWIRKYIVKWLESPVQTVKGELVERQGKGTPQGGVISPLLSNLFLHYVLDKWLEKKYPHTKFVRFADDIIVHCSSEENCLEMLEAIRIRLSECNLCLNEEKTKIVYCQTSRRVRRKDYSKKFDFLGFTFKPRRMAIKETGRLFIGYDYAISKVSESRIKKSWRILGIHKRSDKTIQDISKLVRESTMGVIKYFSCNGRTWTLKGLFYKLDFRIVKWARKKYKSMKGSYRRAYRWLEQTKLRYRYLFYHWQLFAKTTIV